MLNRVKFFVSCETVTDIGHVYVIYDDTIVEGWTEPVDRGGSHIKFLVMQWSQRHIQISRCLCPSLVCSGSLPSALQLRWL
ncbi:unnamed protein product [Pleuronectes platessa]|uniref:Uncharacterized protein n=1 Tax=Pleuronectes platessa TaxID=8262 RepID=A0A9N7UDD3_PLEPL|nr:unnamed protein product [Pleuronectes platessa]